MATTTTGGSILSNTNSSQFTPRRVRLAAAGSSIASHTALFGDAPAQSVSQGRLGGGIGLHGSTASSRALMGGDSAKGLGMGQAWAARAHMPSVTFHNQLGRSESGPTAATASEAATGVPYRQKRKLGRSGGGAASQSVLATAPQTWRFLKEGGSDGAGAEGATGLHAHSRQPLPQPIPLTAAAREYLAQYERSQAAVAAAAHQGDSHQTFTALLHSQHREKAHTLELQRLSLQHQAFQHAFGRVDFEEFVARREEFAEWARRKEAQQDDMQGRPHEGEEQEEEGKQEEDHPHHHQHQHHESDAAVAAGIAARLSLKNHFVPAHLILPPSATSAAAAGKRRSVGGVTTGAASSSFDPKSSRAEFLAQLDRMDADGTSMRSSLTHAESTGEARTPPPPPPPREPNQPGRSRPTSKRGAAGKDAMGATTSSSNAAEDEKTNHQHAEEEARGGGETEIPFAAPDDAAEDAHESTTEGQEQEEKGQRAEEEEASFRVALHSHAITAELIREMEQEEAAQAQAQARPGPATAAAAASVAPAPSSRGRFRRRKHGRHSQHDEEGEEEAEAEEDEEHGEAAETSRAPSTAGGLKASDLPRSSRPSSSRPHAHASASASSSGSSSRSTSRGSSPVILWRATNHVREALDIPAELRSVFLREDDDDDGQGGDGETQRLHDRGSGGGGISTSHHHHRKLTASYAPQSLTTLQRIALTRTNDFDAASSAMQELELNLNPRYQAVRQRAKMERFQKARTHMAQGGSAATVQALLAQKPAPPESSFTYKQYRPRVPKRYGSWYLPTALWIAEDKPVLTSPISRRDDTGRAHMSLGVWGSVGHSRHGRDTRQVGQAEYEEARARMGRSGLASWEELQQGGGARIGGAASSAAGALPGRAIQGQARTREEEEEIDVADKINSIKAAALEARARRRRALEKAKVDQYERKRAAKKAHIVARAMERKGVFRQHTAAVDQDAQEALLLYGGQQSPAGVADSPSSSSQFKARANASAHGGGTIGGVGGTHPNNGLFAGGPLVAAPPAASLEEKLALLREQIPHLQIAQEYKLYVQSLGARVPHYLELTDSTMAAVGGVGASSSAAAAAMYYDEAPGGALSQAAQAQHHHASGVPISSAAGGAGGPSMSSSGSDDTEAHHHAVPMHMQGGAGGGGSRTARNRSSGHHLHIQGGLGQRVNFAAAGAGAGAGTGAQTERGDYRFR